MVELAFQIALLIILVPIALIIILAVGGGILALIGAFLWSITFGLFQDQKEFMASKRHQPENLITVEEDDRKIIIDKKSGEVVNRLESTKENVSFFGPFKVTKIHQKITPRSP